MEKGYQLALYRKRTQSNEYKKLLFMLISPKSYKNKQQNKIKSAYYGQRQFSLQTVCIYMKEDKKVTCKS